ncbi:MAG TPA: hypothetical protein PKV33_08765 [Methanothrix sp.]|nr:hypothetical protein [Methanothrix sp.]
MLKIQCCNEKCTAPEGIFPWDERPNLQADGKLARKGEEGAVSFVERCPFCGMKNKFYVTKVQKKSVTRNMI